MSASNATASAYAEHRAYVAAVLRRRFGWLDPADREAFVHDAFAVCLEKQHGGRLDLEAMRPQQVRAYLTQTALNKAMDEGKRAAHRREVSLDASVLDLASTDEPLDEVMARRFDGRRLRDILAELPPRQRSIVELRFLAELEPHDIALRLGISMRAYRRDLERALRALADRAQLARDGRLCERRRSTILAYLAGICGPNRSLLARRHLASCRSCAAWAAAARSERA